MGRYRIGHVKIRRKRYRIGHIALRQAPSRG